MLLSIVVPVYGVELWIKNCLRSIIDKPEFERCCELIIVDDGSLDQSIHIAEQVCRALANVKLIRQENQGLSVARNAGASKANGRFLWFIDSDDWLTTDGLALVVDALERYPNLDALNLDYVMSNGLHSTVINHAKPTFLYQGVEYLSISTVQNPVQYYVWSTAFYQKYDLHFAEGLYHEDTLFTPIALYYAGRVRRLANDCYVYNLREGSIMSSGNKFKHAMDMVEIVDRLEVFRTTACARGAAVLSAYSAVAVGGIYFYWKQLRPDEKRLLTQRLRPLNLARPVLRSGKFKYLLAILRMSLISPMANS